MLYQTLVMNNHLFSCITIVIAKKSRFYNMSSVAITAIKAKSADNVDGFAIIATYIVITSDKETMMA